MEFQHSINLKLMSNELLRSNLVVVQWDDNSVLL